MSSLFLSFRLNILSIRTIILRPSVVQVLQEMLDHIDRQQRNKLKLDNLSIPSPERHRPLRHQFSSDNMHVPPFNIPNLRIDQRKTSSAEDMARKNSTGLCGAVTDYDDDDAVVMTLGMLMTMMMTTDN